MITTPDNSPKFNTFLFLAPYSVGSIQDTNITVHLPASTDVTNLKAVFDYTGKSVNINGTEQVSGVTANDFTNPLTYTIVSSDGSEKNYTVTLTSP